MDQNAVAYKKRKVRRESYCWWKFSEKSNNNNKTKEQNLKETCAKSEWSLLLDIEYPYKKTGDRATRSKCRSFQLPFL